MDYSILEKKLDNIKDLSSLTVVANNIIQMTRNPKTSALEVADAISQDPALTSRILRIANSAIYGFPQKITTVHHCIVILGFANIRNIIITASVFDKFPSKSHNTQFDREGFWEHSLACAITSKMLAKRLGMKNGDEAFIWGLLHDIGKIVLDTYFNVEFNNVIELTKEKDLHIREAEEQVFGFDHALVGGIVAEKWNLPTVLINVIRFHHNPSLAKESTRMATIVHIADILCRSKGIGNGGDTTIPVTDKGSIKLLGVDSQTMKQFLSDMDEEFKSVDSFLPLIK
jgi:putative nucleotidyltransferase with HDIG domain